MGSKVRIDLTALGITLPAGTDFTLEFDDGVLGARNPFDPENDFDVKQYDQEALPTLHNLASTAGASAALVGDGIRIAGFLTDKDSVATFTVDGDDFELVRALQSSASASAGLIADRNDFITVYGLKMSASASTTAALDELEADYVLESTAQSSATAETLLDAYDNTIQYEFTDASGFNGNTFKPFNYENYFGYDTSDTRVYPILVDWGDGSTQTISNRTQLLAGHSYTTNNTTLTVKFTFNDTPHTIGGHQWTNEIGNETLQSTNFDIRPVRFSKIVHSPHADRFFIGPTNFFPNSTRSLKDAFWRDEDHPLHLSNFNMLRDADLDALDTSKVSDFTRCFRGQRHMNIPLNDWDTSTATNMSEMFSGCQLFNQTLQSWDVSNVVDMSSMFANAFAFNQALSQWDTGSCTTMESMFVGGIAPIGCGGWDTSSLENCSEMFEFATNMNSQTFDQWDASSIQNCSGMFADGTGNTITTSMGLEDWSITSLTNCDNLFSRTSITNANADSFIIRWKDYVVANSGPTNVSANNLFPSDYTPSTAANTAINTLNNTYNWDITY